MGVALNVSNLSCQIALGCCCSSETSQVGFFLLFFLFLSFPDGGVFFSGAHSIVEETTKDVRDRETSGSNHHGANGDNFPRGSDVVVVECSCRKKKKSLMTAEASRKRENDRPNINFFVWSDGITRWSSRLSSICSPIQKKKKGRREW